MSTLIIAEAGVNHNGSLILAKKLIEAAKNSGADAVKFQSFKTESVVSTKAEKAEYQKRTIASVESQFEMVKKLELSESDHRQIIAHCRQVGIVFLSSPFDEASVEMLDRLGVEQFKVASGEITNLPFLEFLARLKKPLILSTGMSTLDEVNEAVGLIQSAGNPRLSLLHCVTEYPAPFDQINLRAMRTLERRFHLPVGYSDHSAGIEIAVAAVALGAAIIEKHMTLDQNMPGPDHQASIEPSVFKEMVTAIRHVERSLGDGLKQPAQCELKNMAIARKSIVAARDIKKGEVLTREHLAIKRPGNGIPPKEIVRIVGMEAVENIICDDILEWRKLK